MSVIVIGSCNTDLICYGDRLPRPGETVNGHSFETGCGGKGGNQAVIAARMGASVTMVAKLGNDIYGHKYMSSLKTEHINTDHVDMLAEATSGVALINVDKQGENSITIVPGANDLLDENDVTRAERLIAGSKVMLCQLEIKINTTLAALRLAKQHNVCTILTPAPVQALSDEFYLLTNYLCANKTEAELLSGVRIQDIQDTHKAIQALVAKGCSCVIVTLGKDGCVYGTRADSSNATEDANAGSSHVQCSDIVHVSAPTVTPVDTTGAGDAFAGALAYYLSNAPGLSQRECMRRACCIAAMSVQHKGTQASYPHRHQIDAPLLYHQ